METQKRQPRKGTQWTSQKNVARGYEDTRPQGKPLLNCFFNSVRGHAYPHWGSLDTWKGATPLHVHGCDRMEGRIRGVRNRSETRGWRTGDFRIESQCGSRFVCGYLIWQKGSGLLGWSGVLSGIAGCSAGRFVRVWVMGSILGWGS